MTPNEHQIRVTALTRACASTGSILDTVTPEQLALPKVPGASGFGLRVALVLLDQASEEIGPALALFGG